MLTLIKKSWSGYINIKVNCRAKNITNVKDCYFKVTKESVQLNTKTLDVYTPNKDLQNTWCKNLSNYFELNANVLLLHHKPNWTHTEKV